MSTQQDGRTRRISDTDKARVATKALINAARDLNVSGKDLARIVGLSPAQISKMRNGEKVLTGKAQQLGVLFVRLYRGLIPLVGDAATASDWLNNHNTALKRRPIDLLGSPEGLVRVIQYVDFRRAPS